MEPAPRSQQRAQPAAVELHEGDEQTGDRRRSCAPRPAVPASPAARGRARACRAGDLPRRRPAGTPASRLIAAPGTRRAARSPAQVVRVGPDRAGRRTDHGAGTRARRRAGAAGAPGAADGGPGCARPLLPRPSTSPPWPSPAPVPRRGRGARPPGRWCRDDRGGRPPAPARRCPAGAPGAARGRQTARRCRPRLRRELRTARPARVRMRVRNPWTRWRRRLFGWKVRLLTGAG